MEILAMMCIISVSLFSEQIGDFRYYDRERFPYKSSFTTYTVITSFINIDSLEWGAFPPSFYYSPLLKLSAILICTTFGIGPYMFATKSKFALNLNTIDIPLCFCCYPV